MSSDYNIKMSLNDTLELDAIIQEWTNPSNIIKESKADGSYNLNGIQTSTGIFNPEDPGQYNFDINGQTIKIKVTDPSVFPSTSIGNIEDFESGNIDEYKQDTNRFTVQTSDVIEGSYSVTGTSTNGSGTPINSSDCLIYSKSIDNSPGRGYEFKYDWIFRGDGNGWQSVVFCFRDIDNYYYAGCHNNQKYWVYKVMDGSIVKSNVKSASGGSYDPDTQYTATVQIYDDGEIRYSDSNGGSNSVSITDSEWNNGGFGWVVSEDSNNDGTDTTFDNARVTNKL